MMWSRLLPMNRDRSTKIRSSTERVCERMIRPVWPSWSGR